jgi:O-antigen ligase
MLSTLSDQVVAAPFLRVLNARVVVRWLPAVVSFFVLAADGIAGGAYFPRAWRLTTLAFLALAAAALIARTRIALSFAERCVLASLAGLAAWAALSSRWSLHPHTSVLEGERDLVYLVAVAAVLLSVDRDSLPQLLAGALGGVTVICGYGLVTHVFFGHGPVPIEGKLLFEPLGYANGLGIYAAIGLLLAVGLAFATPWAPARVACIGCVAILAPTLYLTESRAAMLALAAGLVVLLVFGRGMSRRAALVGAAAAVGLVIAVVLMHQTAERSLLTQLFGENRPRYWHVAWREFTENRFLGSGAGTFDEFWLDWRTVDSYARDAHNLYLETLAELGIPGLLLLVSALLPPLLVLRRGRDPVRATAAAGYVAYLIHTGVDWDWELPATTIAGLLCGAALLIDGRDENARELSGRMRAVLLFVIVVLAVVAFVRLHSGPRLPFAP